MSKKKSAGKSHVIDDNAKVISNDICENNKWSKCKLEWAEETNIVSIMNAIESYKYALIVVMFTISGTCMGLAIEKRTNIILLVNLFIVIPIQQVIENKTKEHIRYQAFLTVYGNGLYYRNYNIINEQLGIMLSKDNKKLKDKISTNLKTPIIPIAFADGGLALILTISQLCREKDKDWIMCVCAFAVVAWAIYLVAKNWNKRHGKEKLDELVNKLSGFHLQQN